MEAYKDPVPYIVYESTVARFERTVRRLITVVIIAVVMIVTSNAAWLYAWNCYDYATEKVTVDAESTGNANYIGTSGVINNGESDSEKANKEEKGR